MCENCGSPISVPVTDNCPKEDYWSTHTLGAKEIEKAFGILIKEPPILFPAWQMDKAEQDGLMLVLSPELSMREMNEKYKLGKLLWSTWMEGEDFYKEELKDGWYLIAPKILEGSTGKAWDEQKKMVEGLGYEVPTAPMILNLLALNFAKSGECLYRDYWTRTQTISGGGLLVDAGPFVANGACVSGGHPGSAHVLLGSSLSLQS